MIRKASIFALLFFLLVSLRSYGQMERDTVYYEIQSDMIDRVSIQKVKKTRYIGNFLAVVYEGKIISDSPPVITDKISGGRVSTGMFKKKEKAERIRQQIVGEDK